jgi:NTP pyrophosphatase (non-canonical NTP hydrolase)
VESLYTILDIKQIPLYKRNPTLEANTYQELAFGTAHGPYASPGTGLPLAILALGGEAGELANEMKKVLERKNPEVDLDKFIKELGDVQWYVAMVATMLGVTLGQVMEVNLAKLQKRYEERNNESVPSSNVQPEGTDSGSENGAGETGNRDNIHLVDGNGVTERSAG